MNKNGDNKEDKFHFVELFLVAADVQRTFAATRLERQHDNGEKFYTAAVIVQEGEIISASESKSGVQKNLDVMCVLKLDYGLHKAGVKSSLIFHCDCFHN